MGTGTVRMPIDNILLPDRLACTKQWDIDGMEKDAGGEWHKIEPVKCEFRAVTNDQLMSHYTLHRAWELAPVQSELVLRGLVV